MTLQTKPSKPILMARGSGTRRGAIAGFAAIALAALTAQGAAVPPSASETSLPDPALIPELRASLPAWESSAPVPESRLIVNYRRYYDLDFTNCTHRWGQIEVDGKGVFLTAWTPPVARGTVLVVHGYYDHVGIMARVVNALLQRGFAVLAYDQPGHGLSDGAPACIDSFVEYARVFERVVRVMEEAALPRPWHLVAHSMGAGIVAERLLTEGRAPFDRIVLLAPLVRSAHWGSSRFGVGVSRHFTDSVPRVFRRNTSDESFMEFVQRDPLQARRQSLLWASALAAWNKRFKRLKQANTPLLVLQGTEDTTVDVRYNLKILKRKFPQARFKEFEGLGHQLMNESPQGRQQVLKSMGQYLDAEDNPPSP